MRGNQDRQGCTLVLARHAHTQMAGRFCGSSDPSLSAHGIAQLSGLHQKLTAYALTHIFCSPLQRAQQTALSIAKHRALPVTLVPDLRELAFGCWEGLNWDEVVARDREYAGYWLDHYPDVAAPGGERFVDFVPRVQSAMKSIAKQTGSGVALVVTHAGVIRTFMRPLTPSSGAACGHISCDYACTHEVYCKGGEWFAGAHDSEASISAAVLPAQQSAVRP